MARPPDGDGSGLDSYTDDDEGGGSGDEGGGESNLGDVPATDEKKRRPTGCPKDAIVPVGRLLLQQKDSAFSVHLDSNVENSCHWNCMLPVFVVLFQAKLLPENDEVTAQAGGYFAAVRDVASGMNAEMTKPVRVSDPSIRVIHYRQ